MLGAAGFQNNWLFLVTAILQHELLAKFFRDLWHTVSNHLLNWKLVTGSFRMQMFVSKQVQGVGVIGVTAVGNRDLRLSPTFRIHAALDSTL